MLIIKSLRKRADFLRLRRSRYYHAAGFTLRAEKMPEGLEETETHCRVGFTVSKYVSKKAVMRNNIKRRLREIVRQCWPEHAKAGHDYVLIAKAQAAELTFDQLRQDAIAGLKRLHRGAKSVKTTKQDKD